jgi:Zn-dependent protease
MDIAQIIQTITIYAIPVLFAITVHEAAHGYAARYFGDPTAEQMGRITLNPIKHIDPIGTIAIPLMLYFATAGAFLFGYAKPVPVDFSRLRRPKHDMIWVALAGPAVNLAQAIGWAIAFYLLIGSSVQEEFWLSMCKAGILVNIVMFVFNLFPLPPMDGGRILVGLLPWRQAMVVSRIEPFGFFIVLGLLVAGIISTFWMRPLMAVTYQFIDLLLTPLRWIIGG